MESDSAISQVKELCNLENVVTFILNKDIKKTGLTVAELLLLRTLLEAPRYTLTTGEITAKTCTQKSVTSHRIKILQQRGLLGRVTSQEDKRKINITLTAKGRRAAELASGLLVHSFTVNVLPILKHEQREALHAISVKGTRL